MDIYPKKGHLEFSGAFSWLKFSRRWVFIPIIFGSLDFHMWNYKLTLKFGANIKE